MPESDNAVSRVIEALATLRQNALLAFKTYCQAADSDALEQWRRDGAGGYDDVRLSVFESLGWKPGDLFGRESPRWKTDALGYLGKIRADQNRSLGLCDEAYRVLFEFFFLRPADNPERLEAESLAVEQDLRELMLIAGGMPGTEEPPKQAAPPAKPAPQQQEPLAGQGTEKASEEWRFAPTETRYSIAGFGQSGYLPKKYKGLSDIARLIATPDVPVSMLDLDGADQRLRNDHRSHQPVVDADGKQKILNELQVASAVTGQ
jgi:hypothetical protein